MPTSSNTASPKRRHLLIDGDVIAYMAAVVAQGTLVDDAGWHSPIANETEGEVIVENTLFGLKKGLGAESFTVYLSDPTENWRKLVDPTYKSNRTGERPLLLGYLKQYLQERHKAEWWPGLEADDVLGIQMTTPSDDGVPCSRPDGPGSDKDYVQRICVGRDKDFNSIPGLHHTIGKDRSPDGKKFLTRSISLWEADRFHLMQTLAGDRVDGYYGCPGIGMDRAASIIDCPMRLVPTKGVKTRGVNKGEEVTRWVGEPTSDLWACVVSHYQKAGLGEAEALVTARLARILRYGEYDKETQGVALWRPIKLSATRELPNAA